MGVRFDYLLTFLSSIRELEDYPERLNDVYSLYMSDGATKQFLGTTIQDFINIVGVVLGDRHDHLVQCSMCSKPEWSEDVHTDSGGNEACESCFEDLSACAYCDAWSTQSGYLTVVDDEGYCQSCLDDHCSWCEDCSVYYQDGNADDHNHSRWCACKPQPLNFKILANSHGVLNQDERLLVELAHGHIPEQAIYDIYRMLWNEQFSDVYEANGRRTEAYYGELCKVVDRLEPVWHVKVGGNYTKRLSKALYEHYKALEINVKLEPGLLSRIGAKVREHAGTTNSWFVEFTRDLNQGPEAFFNGGSCWWGGSAEGVCALKSWGGLAMRSYLDVHQESRMPSGRAWVQPLNEDLKPTAEIFDAHAYVVYNGYGNLDGYTPARLVAYLTSRTYKKISFEASYQYINAGGYLVADQETCNATDGVFINDLDCHKVVAA